jgi:hypothetical protein
MEKKACKSSGLPTLTFCIFILTACKTFGLLKGLVAFLSSSARLLSALGRLACEPHKGPPGLLCS